MIIHPLSKWYLIKVRELAEVTDMSIGSIDYMPTDKMIRKRCAPDGFHRNCFMNMFQLIAWLYYRFVAVDDGWIHQYTPERKES